MTREEKLHAFNNCCENHDYCDDCLLSCFGKSPCYAPYAMTDKELDIALLLVKGDCDFTELVKACETMKWTSVKDHLPKKTDFYIVYVGDGVVAIDEFCKGEWIVYSDDVTHWMPKPPPPKEDDE